MYNPLAPLAPLFFLHGVLLLLELAEGVHLNEVPRAAVPRGRPVARPAVVQVGAHAREWREWVAAGAGPHCALTPHLTTRRTTHNTHTSTWPRKTEQTGTVSRSLTGGLCDCDLQRESHAEPC